jgi:hypothetical protein
MNALPRLAIALLLISLTNAALAQPRSGGRQRPDRGGPSRRAMQAPDNLKIGAPAPDFKLRTADGKREVQLSSFKGKRPVVLVFGSYT